jgi:hypothetical protein
MPNPVRIREKCGVGGYMKRFFVSAVMLALLSTPAFAGKNSQTVTVTTALKAGSTTLPPGDYDLTWTGSGPDTQVTFMQRKKVVVTLAAKLIEETNKNEELDIDTQSGVNVLKSIHTRSVTLIFKDSSSPEK